MKNSKIFLWAMILVAVGWFISMIIVTHLNQNEDKMMDVVGRVSISSFIMELALMLGVVSTKTEEDNEPRDRYCKKQGYEYWYEDKGYLVCGKITDGKKVERYMIKIDELPK